MLGKNQENHQNPQSLEWKNIIFLLIPLRPVFTSKLEDHKGLIWYENWPPRTKNVEAMIFFIKLVISMQNFLRKAFIFLKYEENHFWNQFFHPCYWLILYFWDLFLADFWKIGQKTEILKKKCQGELFSQFFVKYEEIELNIHFKH